VPDGTADCRARPPALTGCASAPPTVTPARAASRCPPSDWTFELIEQYHAVIRSTAERFGLDTYPNQLEIITAEQMMDAYASVGMPVNYRHWSYGKEFIATERSYKRGQMGLAYEIVINSNPCIAYLMEENTMAMQALVIAHAAYGHNSFFKGNYLFRMWTDASSSSTTWSCQELRRRMRGALRRWTRWRPARLLPRADEPRRGPLPPPGKLSLAQERARARTARPTRSSRSTTCGAPAAQGRGPEEGARASPRSRRRTCCTSSRRTRRCWSPGSARSCASCARSRSTSTRSARPR
jgi:stage V sporulation protein R